MSKPALLSILFAFALGLAACAGSAAPTASEASPTPGPKPVVTEIPPQAPAASPTPVPTPGTLPNLDLTLEDQGLALGLSNWQDVQTALGKEFMGIFDMGSYQCEWEILGKEELKVFIRYGCEFDGGNGARGAGPAIIYLKEPGVIERVFIPKVSETEWDANPDVPASIHEAYRKANSDLMSRLILRRGHPELPPFIALKPGTQPQQPLTVAPVFAAGTEPAWRQYEKALAQEWYGTTENILCEWAPMGEVDGKVYLAPTCEPLDRSQMTFRIPYCILTETEPKTWQAGCHQAVELDGAYTLDPAYFPAEVREKYLEVSSQNIMPRLDHIELRRWYPDLPPLAAQ